MEVGWNKLRTTLFLTPSLCSLLTEKNWFLAQTETMEEAELPICLLPTG